MNLLSPGEAEYSGESISNLQLENKTIQNKRFEECIFENCSFISCQIKNCTFIDCEIRGCVLSALKPTNSRFVSIIFDGTKAVGIDWTQLRELRDISIKNSSVDYGNFRLLNLEHMSIVNSTAIEADFTEAVLKGSDLSGTDFGHAVFSKTDLTNVDLRHAKNYQIDVYNNTLKKAKFSFPEAVNLLITSDIKIEYE